MRCLASKPNPKALNLTMCAVMSFFFFCLSPSLLSGLSHQDYSSILLSFSQHKNQKDVCYSRSLSGLLFCPNNRISSSTIPGAPRQRLRKPLLVVTSVPCSTGTCCWDVWSFLLFIFFLHSSFSLTVCCPCL